VSLFRAMQRRGRLLLPLLLLLLAAASSPVLMHRLELSHLMTPMEMPQRVDTINRTDTTINVMIHPSIAARR